jgi:hybrid polyketide synthase/nonribosomal peptide synthetase ACE1
MLYAADVSFAAVVGHSSGEIGAAYAASLVSAKDTIRIAYFRGVYTKLASSPNPHAPRGGIIAVGTSVNEARALYDLDEFKGRI